MGLFKNDLEKFYELLSKTNKDNNVDFGVIGGKKLIVFVIEIKSNFELYLKTYVLSITLLMMKAIA